VKCKIQNAELRLRRLQGGAKTRNAQFPLFAERRNFSSPQGRKRIDAMAQITNVTKTA